MEKNKNLELAIYLSQELGLCVFPVKVETESNSDRTSKMPLISSTKVNKQVSGGPSNRFEQIKSWWDMWTDANVGIPLRDNHIWGLDVDIDKERGIDGWKTLEKYGITKEYLIETCSAYETTPRGGYHFYYKDSEFISRNTNTVFGDGVEVKYNAFMTSGEGYQWGKVLQKNISPAPQKLIEPIRDYIQSNPFHSSGSSKTFTEGYLDDYWSKKVGDYWMQQYSLKTLPGNRNDNAYKMFGQMHSNGVSPEIAHDYVTEYIDMFDETDDRLTYYEIDATYKSAYDSPLLPPANLPEDVLPFDPRIIPPDTPFIDDGYEPDDIYEAESFVDATIVPSTTKSCRFRLRTPKDIKEDRTPKKFILEGVIREKSLNMIAGAYGHRKTWLALSMAVCVAGGKRWAGLRTIQSPVLIVNEETDEDDLDDRIEATLEGERLTKDVPIYSMSLSFFNFFKGIEEHRDAGIYFNEDMQHLEDYIIQTGAKLCIIDAYRDVMAGFKENNQEDNIPILLALRQVCIRTGCAILILHHFNKGGKYSGSTGIMQCLENGINVDSDPKQLLIKLSSEKVRNTAYMNKTMKMWYIVSEDDPNTIVSYQITEENTSPFDKKEKLHLNNKHLHILEYIKKHNNELIIEDYKKNFTEEEWNKYRIAIYQLRDADKLVKNLEKSHRRMAVYNAVEEVEFDSAPTQRDIVDEIIKEEQDSSNNNLV